MSELDIEVARWLSSAAGLEAVDSAVAALDAGIESLTLNTRLRRDELPAAHVSAVVTAAVARRRARERWPDADKLLFTRQGLEQASDPVVSAWRAQRFVAADPTVNHSEATSTNPGAVWDLGAGIGGDTMALAAAGAHVTAVDLDPARLVLLEHNAAVRGLTIDTRAGDATALRPPANALIHADPSRRRSEGRRVRSLREYRPSVAALVTHHLDARGMGVVLSPAVDVNDPDLPEDAELEFVQVGDVLVESVAWRGVLRGNALATATLLPAGWQRRRSVELPARLPVGRIGDHLIEVVPAAVRARLHDEVGREIDARRLANGRALLTSEGGLPASPWYRSREILTVLPPRPKQVRRWLQLHEHGPIELVLHGVQAEPTQWWRELGRPARGPDGIRIELIRMDEGAVAVITQAPESPDQHA